HTVPMIAALALRPYERRPDRNLRFGYLDFTLLLLWWMYLYLFVVIPWQYVRMDVGRYGHSYNMLYTLENLVFVLGLGILYLRTTDAWRTVHAHLFGAACTYLLSSLIINVAIDRGAYSTGSIYDVPLVASFVWFGTTGILAFRTCPAAGAASSAVPEDGRPYL